MSSPVAVRHVETGKVYRSMSQAARSLGICVDRINGRSNPLPGYTFKEVGLIKTDQGIDLDIPELIGKERYRSIPGYEGLYSISSKGRIRSDKFKDRYKKISTTKYGQHVVVLSKNSIPTCYTVESLFNLVWLELPIPQSTAKREKCKQVKCVDDGMIFKSYKKCCSNYRIEYGKFLKAAKKANDSKQFQCKGKTFTKLS